jgi:hypothetical protein
MERTSNVRRRLGAGLLSITMATALGIAVAGPAHAGYWTTSVGYAKSEKAAVANCIVSRLKFKSAGYEVGPKCYSLGMVSAGKYGAYFEYKTK